MREIFYNNEKVGYRGRFSFDETALRSHGPDLRLLDVAIGQWLAVYGDRSTPVAMARVIEVQGAECIRVERVAWGDIEANPYDENESQESRDARREVNKAAAMKVLAVSDELSVYISRPPIPNLPLSI